MTHSTEENPPSQQEQVRSSPQQVQGEEQSSPSTNLRASQEDSDSIKSMGNEDNSQSSALSIRRVHDSLKNQQYSLDSRAVLKADDGSLRLRSTDDEESDSSPRSEIESPKRARSHTSGAPILPKKDAKKIVSTPSGDIVSCKLKLFSFKASLKHLNFNDITLNRVALTLKYSLPFLHRVLEVFWVKVLLVESTRDSTCPMVSLLQSRNSC
jgi:hypothetical protein